MTGVTLPGFTFDPNRCTGCAACSLACSTENELGWGTSWRQVVTFNPDRHPSVPSFHLSLACNHCTDAPCVAHCPTGAMHRDPVTGSVLVREDACIGCRYCAWVCPYDAPRFDETRGVMTKCTFCHHRLADGAAPACVEACPTGALGYGALNGAPRLPGFPDAPFGPRIAFQPLRRATPPESSWTLPRDVAAHYVGGGTAPAPAPRGRLLHPVALTFKAELPLWLFTSGMAGLVAWLLAGVTAGVPVSLPVFAAVAAALMGISTLHLGRPARAWRALANARTSRLSREILGVSAFLGTALLWIAWGGGAPAPGAREALGMGAALLGLAALFLVDRVYDPVRPRPAERVHSGDTLVVAPLLAAALAQALGMYLVVGLLTLGALARRLPPSDPTEVALVAVRGVGVLLPPLLWLLLPDAWPGWAPLLVGTGALADRAQLYRTLAIPGPRTQAAADAAAWER